MCPEYPPTSSGSSTKLPHFIAYALYRTKLHSSVTSATLILFQWLKARFPTAHGSLAGHRLFISAFMIASKVICDDTYSNKLWSIVCQGTFQSQEINEIERKMCWYLDWELNIEPLTLKEFDSEMTTRKGCGYDTYSFILFVRKRVLVLESTIKQNTLHTVCNHMPKLEVNHCLPFHLHHPHR